MHHILGIFIEKSSSEINNFYVRKFNMIYAYVAGGLHEYNASEYLIGNRYKAMNIQKDIIENAPLFYAC